MPDITFNQAQVVIYIKEHPFCRIEDIVEDLGIKKNAASRMLHTLDDNEVIEFTIDPSTCRSTMTESAVFESGWIIKPN